MLIRDHNRLEDVPELLKVLPQGIALGLPSQAPNKDLGVGGVPKRGIQELERLGTRAWARNWLILHEQLSITVGGKKKQRTPDGGKREPRCRLCTGEEYYVEKERS